MTKKQTALPATKAGTIEVDPLTDRYASAQRAQAELIEMLARLVLAAVERDSVNTEPPRVHGAVCERR